ncbi:DoxX family protein [Candidatus Dependentiae bacterium]
MTKSEPLEWTLFVVRLIVGIAFIMHGGQKIAGSIGTFGSQGFATAHSPLLACLAPITELIGGGLILAGILIEVGTILVIPVMFFTFLACNPRYLMEQANIKYILNLTMLAIAIGICGPGKWALWDPGKYLRKKIF